MSSLTFGKNEKGSYILCNRSEVWCEIGKFASGIYSSCQNYEKSGSFKGEVWFENHFSKIGLFSIVFTYKIFM